MTTPQILRQRTKVFALDPSTIERLYKEADELTRIFVASRETARRNRRVRREAKRPNRATPRTHEP